jgi:hypothetical protein
MEKRLVKAIDEERIGEMILETYMLLWQLQDYSSRTILMI